MKNIFFRYFFLFATSSFFTLNTTAQLIHKCPVDSAWAKNSVNVTVFRKNSVVTWKDLQYTAFYSAEGYIEMAKRKLGSKHWYRFKTDLKGDAEDAHKTISLILDGEGYIHLCWNEHGNRLHYVKSMIPEGFDFTSEISMTGLHENKVTYPEFYLLPSGDLLFFYRDGGSGNGNLVINQYDVKKKIWKMLQENLIDGEGKRNAYWQACTDDEGNVYISWVWRESPDVMSNHDMCFAMSSDGGKLWTQSNGLPYSLPITAQTAEYICRIPENSSLINQTSMFAFGGGSDKKILIASYWQDSMIKVPQYHILYFNNKEWNVSNLGFRKQPFALGGLGTKSISISRPQIVACHKEGNIMAALVFRDKERGNKVSIAINKNMATDKWNVIDVDDMDVGAWEPSYDTELWKYNHKLNLFVQPVVQIDGEGLANHPATIASIWELSF